VLDCGGADGWRRNALGPQRGCEGGGVWIGEGRHLRRQQRRQATAANTRQCVVRSDARERQQGRACLCDRSCRRCPASACGMLNREKGTSCNRLKSAGPAKTCNAYGNSAYWGCFRTCRASKFRVGQMDNEKRVVVKRKVQQSRRLRRVAFRSKTDKSLTGREREGGRRTLFGALERFGRGS
jgi:hypothetical protein